MKINKILVIFCLIIPLSSCSDDDKAPIEPGLTPFEGHIIYEYTSDVKIIDLSNWEESSFFSFNAYSTNGWMVSKDGKLRLISEREPGTFRETVFRLVDAADGTIIKEFEYVPKVGTNQNYTGQLSYDNSLILINPDFDNGIVIMDADGEVKYRLDAINDEVLGIDDKAYWLPDNSILVAFNDQYILKSDPPYSSLSLVKEMNYEQWGNLRVSMDGQKISLYIGNNIYLMNVDGSELVQVTESDGTENFGEFSPDGRYLLVGADYVHAPNAGLSNWRLKIIPADGKLYNLDEDTEVIPVVPKDSDSPVKAGGPTFWRP